jgi:hypothetical protein
LNRNQSILRDALEDLGWQQEYIGFRRHILGATTVEIHPARDVSIVHWPKGRDAVGDGPVYLGPFSGRGWAAYTVRLATAIAQNGLTAQESGILVHALGGSSRKRLGWRDYYVANDGDARPACDGLAARGLLDGNGKGAFWVTVAGRAVVGLGPTEGDDDAGL